MSHDDTAPTLVSLLRHNARQRPHGVALRHKHLGIWQEKTWQQIADDTASLASALNRQGFGRRERLLILSHPSPHALLLALAATWLGGVATLLEPDSSATDQSALLRHLHAEFVFAESLEQARGVLALPQAPHRLVYLDARGFDRQQQPFLQSYAELLSSGSPAGPEVQAHADEAAFSFWRYSPPQGAVQQSVSHAEAVREGRHLVSAERIGSHETAFAARAFATSAQLRYLLAPWLLAGFSLNFPENQASRDDDRRELGPTLVAGTRDTYTRLYHLLQQRLPEPGSRLRRLVDWSLQPQGGWLRRSLGHGLVTRPLRDVIGFSRVRLPLLLGEPLPNEIWRFFEQLQIPIRHWPDMQQLAPQPPVSADGAVQVRPVGGWREAGDAVDTVAPQESRA